ncbi:MAG: hypothetical protein WBF06_02105 [Candidatus Acidiferrales bacterium]
MTELLLHKRTVKSVFSLLGEHENAITYSVAWALSQSPHLLGNFVHYALGIAPDLSNVVIRLQQHEKQAGITDIEIESPGKFFLIVEAKRGWTLPSQKQLKTYAQRPSFRASKGLPRRILVMSECSREFALLNLETRKTSGVEIHPISWKQMARLAVEAQSDCSHAERRILRELLTYLRGLMTMQNIDSNWVYVVSLGSGTPEGWKISLIDIVKKRRRYFHPVGKTWPKEPPNYVAFRYHGKLQSIHHIEGYDIFLNPHDKFAEIPNNAEWGPHFLYKLGPAFSPARTIRTGPRIQRNRRSWCMLDTLFVAKTISEAEELSNKRSDQAG